MTVTKQEKATLPMGSHTGPPIHAFPAGLLKPGLVQGSVGGAWNISVVLDELSTQED